MTPNEIKAQKQAEALQAVINNGGSGLIAAATGVGKSKIGVDYSKIIVKEKPKANILLVVPTEHLRDVNWMEEYIKWGQEVIWTENLQRACYISINNIEGEEFDLVILDEAHRITLLSSGFFEKNIVHKVLALTATEPTKEIKKHLLHKYGINTVYTIPLDEAVSLGLVSPYEIIVVGVPLSNINNYVGGSEDKPFMTSEERQYEYLTDKITGCKDKDRNTRVLNRMHFIYNLQSKTEAAKHILSLIPQDWKTLIFAGSIKQAIELEPHTFNSQSSSKDFEAFKKGDIMRLSSITKVNEGENVPDLNCGLVVQVNSNDIDLIQRTGRTIRYKENHIGIMIILVALGTQDEEWSNMALSSFDPSRIRRVRFDNIKTGRELLFKDKETVYATE